MFVTMDRSEVASTSSRTQRDGAKSSWSSHSLQRGGAKLSWSSRSLTECPISKLFEQEFYARYYIPESISIQLSDGEALSIDEFPNNMIYFIKEQFATGLHLPIPSLVKQLLHFSRIPHAFIHPNIIQILMGCSVLNTLYQLDLSLLEVLFVYTIKMSPKERFSLLAHIPYLQFVIELLNCRTPVRVQPKDMCWCSVHRVDQLRVQIDYLIPRVL